MSQVVTQDMIKELRDRTGVGIGKCKEALSEAKGDMELAIANLRKAGIASAVKKEGRVTNEGKIEVNQNDAVVAVIEVNAETDFVVRNARFQTLLSDMAQEIVKTRPHSLEAFMAQKFSKDGAMTIDQYRATVMQAIGENIQIKRLLCLEKGKNSSFGVYSHLDGKIAVVIEIEGSTTAGNLAKDIAMHIAAAHPQFVSEDEVPAHLLEHEREIAKAQIKGKPDNIVEKIVQGKINAFYDMVCLNRQKYIKDDSISIAELLQRHSKECDGHLKIRRFVRWAVGESC